MAAIAFVGDSFCASYFSKNNKDGWPPPQHGITEPTYLDLVAESNSYTLCPYGFGGKGWWYSRQRFLEDLQRIPKEIFADQLEVIVFCHTNSGRINNAWNRELSNTDTTSPEAQLFYRHFFDGDFHDWAQQQWFKEINQQWSHIKTVHFHCFTESVKWSNLLPGVVYTTPLIHVSIGELQGTDKEIDQAIKTDKRYNHLSTRNNQVLAEFILGAIYDYNPGQYEIDMSNFDIINSNAVNFPRRGYGTK
jgi:hypothetical protein